jgi:hypothetical protein
MNDMLDIYTNSIQVTAGLYEVALSLYLDTPGEDGAERRKVATVRMSPQQAMALQILLQRYLKAYGEQFQEIFLPDDLVKRLSGSEEAETT